VGLVEPRRSLTSIARCGWAAWALSCGAPTTAGDGGAVPSDGAPSACAPPGISPRLWVSTSDYQSGTLALLDPLARCALPAIGRATADTLLARHGDAIVALQYEQGRTDEIAAYAPAADGSLTLLGSGSPRRAPSESANVRGYLPLDRDRAIYARNDGSSLGVWSLSSHGTIGEVSLAQLTGGGPRAAPSAIVTDGARIFVTLQRWDAARLDAPRPGALAVLDPRTLALIDADPRTTEIDAIELPRANPFGAVAVSDGVLFVPCAGALRDGSDGAVVRVDAARLRVIDEIAPESALGGNPLHALSLSPERLLLVAMSEPATGSAMSVARTALLEWSIPLARVIRTWIQVPGYSLTPPVLGQGGRVYVGDRGFEQPARPAGVVAFDAVTGDRLWREPVPTGLPPYALLAE
jgi:hypothetical protein